MEMTRNGRGGFKSCFAVVSIYIAVNIESLTYLNEHVAQSCSFLSAFNITCPHACLVHFSDQTTVVVPEEEDDAEYNVYADLHSDEDYEELRNDRAVHISRESSCNSDS